jgi:opacity protein-like surface antigen
MKKLQSYFPVLLSVASAALVVIASTPAAHADSVTIAADPTAASSNFQSSGATAQVGYNINTSDDGTSFLVTLTSSDPNRLDFANLYFDSVANNGLGSDLGIETTNYNAFDPNTGTPNDLHTVAGYSATIDDNGTTSIISVIIPNTFFLNDPLGIGFAKTPDGSDVSIHLSQSFGYSVVGGGANFAAPAELGEAQVGSAVAAPEPSSLVFLGTGILGAAGAFRKRFLNL